MKKYFSFIIILIFNAIFAQAPLTISQKIKSWPVNADEFVGRDQFGHLYFLTDNVLTKDIGTRTLDYKNLAKGKITHVDIQNPLLILVFYQTFNTIVLLDDQMNEVSQFTFNNPDFPIQAHAAGIASQNRLWIYDSLKQQIILFDYKQNSYRSLTNSFVGNFKHYESDFNEFRWIDEKGNRYSCDIYGKIKTLGKVPDFDQCRIVSDDLVLYQLMGKLYCYSLSGDKSVTINPTEKTFKSFWYKDQILSIFTKEGITNYKITLP